MAPLVHMVFRQSRTVRDVIVMSCMLDLARDDVSTALDLGVARIEALARACAFWAQLVAERLADHALVLRRRAEMLLPTLVLIGWFALPMSAIAAVCAILMGMELQMVGH